MLKKISLQIELTCPSCGAESKHEHDFELQSSLIEYKDGGLTAIGHTKPLYEGSLRFNCQKCKCWHSVVMEPFEVHVHPEEKSRAVNCTHEHVYGAAFMEDYNEDDGFEPCNDCDLPDACSDFGCAIKSGIKKDVW